MVAMDRSRFSCSRLTFHHPTISWPRGPVHQWGLGPIPRSRIFKPSQLDLAKEKVKAQRHHVTVSHPRLKADRAQRNFGKLGFPRRKSEIVTSCTLDACASGGNDILGFCCATHCLTFRLKNPDLRHPLVPPTQSATERAKQPLMLCYGPMMSAACAILDARSAGTTGFSTAKDLHLSLQGARVH